jgi:nitroreductase
MELSDALTSTPATRAFTDRPIDDATLFSILDEARFAPSGGNRQGWRVVVVKDPAIRRGLRDLYLPGWYEYLAMTTQGMTPFASTNAEAEEASAIERAGDFAALGSANPGFAERLDEVPALLVVLADLTCLATVDRDLDRIGLAGGASIYPFVWSILLGARQRGLGGVMTTMAVRAEAEVLSLLDAPAQTAVAAVVALGEPAEQISRLRRSPVPSFATVDTMRGPALDGETSG